MIERKKVIIKDVDADGDVSAGPIIKDNIITVYNQSDASIYLMNLLKRLEADVKADVRIGEKIKALEHYSRPIENEKVVGLEEKLKRGNREDSKDYAIRVKEAFTKKLVEYQFYEAAQKIFVYLLSLIDSDFNYFVHPLLISGSERTKVDTVICEKIRDKILQQMGENYLDIKATDIDGMIYFLTGNCYIKWE